MFQQRISRDLKLSFIPKVTGMGQWWFWFLQLCFAAQLLLKEQRRKKERGSPVEIEVHENF